MSCYYRDLFNEENRESIFERRVADVRKANANVTRPDRLESESVLLLDQYNVGIVIDSGNLQPRPPE